MFLGKKLRIKQTQTQNNRITKQSCLGYLLKKMNQSKTILRKEKYTATKTLNQNMKNIVLCMLISRGKRIIAKYESEFCFIFKTKLYKTS